jgi:hypothetical protein
VAFTFIASAGGTNDASGTTLDCSGSLNVADGDVLVAWCKYEGAGAATMAVAKSTGSPANTFTFNATDRKDHSNNDLSGGFGYLLSAAADATATFRLTLGAARVYRRLIVMQFRPDAGETVTRDTGNSAQGSATTVASGAITTTGTDEIVCGGYGEYLAATTTSELVNAGAAIEPAASPQGSYTSCWYRILTATFVAGQATASFVGGGEWVCAAIALKSEAAVGGRTTFNAHPTGLGMQHGLGMTLPNGGRYLP